MPASRFERFLQLPGALARLFFAAMPILTAGAPSVADAGPHACVQWLTDHQPAAAISGFAEGYFCVTMLLFVAGLRQALRPGESTYSSAACAGGVTDALAVALMGWLTLASTEAADAESGAAVTTLGYLSEDDVSRILGDGGASRLCEVSEELVQLLIGLPHVAAQLVQ